MSDQIKHVYTAISGVQADIAKTGISKSQKNEQQHYRFRGIDDMYNCLAPLLAKHSLLILPEVIDRTGTERTTAKGTVIFSVILMVNFHFVSAIDGSEHVVKTAGEAMDTGDKATNKAMSAAYKYACIQAFAIPTEGDNDADATTPPEVQPTELKNEIVALRSYAKELGLNKKDYLASIEHVTGEAKESSIKAGNIGEIETRIKEEAE